MVLSDRTIRLEISAGRIVVDPLDGDDIQPSSVDLHLGDDFQVFRNSRYPYIDPAREQARSGVRGRRFLSANAQVRPFRGSPRLAPRGALPLRCRGPATTVGGG